MEVMWLAPGGGAGGNTRFCVEPAIQRDLPTHIPGLPGMRTRGGARLQKAARAAQLGLANWKSQTPP